MFYWSPMSFPRFFSCFLSVICCSPNTKSGCLSYFRLWKKSIPRVLMSLQIVFSQEFLRWKRLKSQRMEKHRRQFDFRARAGFGTFIYAGFGLNIVILLNAFSFLISFLFLTKISYPETISAKRTRLSLSDGLRYITKNQELKTLFIAFMLLNFLVMPTANVFAPGILKIDYHFPTFFMV